MGNIPSTRRYDALAGITTSIAETAIACNSVLRPLGDPLSLDS
jgi:hypothetical protein